MEDPSESGNDTAQAPCLSAALCASPLLIGHMPWGSQVPIWWGGGRRWSQYPLAREAGQFLSLPAVGQALGHAVITIHEGGVWAWLPSSVPRSSTCFPFLCLFSLYHAVLWGGGVGGQAVSGWATVSQGPRVCKIPLLSVSRYPIIKTRGKKAPNQYQELLGKYAQRHS